MNPEEGLSAILAKNPPGREEMKGSLAAIDIQIESTHNRLY
jgi:hypothetical protein